MNKIALTGLTLISLCGSATAAFSRPNYIQRANSVDEVVNRLVGIMDTSKQAKTNSKISSVRMTTCQVTVTPTPKKVVFLYQEQALSKNLSKPYRQRFLQISQAEGRKSVESAGFKPPQPEKWIGLCQRPTEQRVISSQDLGKSECSVFLHKEGDNYVGETQPGGCPINFKGAVKLTNRITLHPKGMDTWDRGYDAKGNVIWGAKQEPYQYLWINPSQPSR